MFKLENKVIYKIDHFYNISHKKSCVFIKTDISLDSLVKIIGSIHFKFENLIDESVCMEEKHLVEILEKFYNVKDVTEEYKKFFSYTQLDEDEWELFNVFKFSVEEEEREIIQIDSYEARESCCGSGYKEIMKNYLPSTDEFEVAIKKLRKFYINQGKE